MLVYLPTFVPFYAHFSTKMGLFVGFYTNIRLFLVVLRAFLSFHWEFSCCGFYFYFFGEIFLYRENIPQEIPEITRYVGANTIHQYWILVIVTRNSLICRKNCGYLRIGIGNLCIGVEICRIFAQIYRRIVDIVDNTWINTGRMLEIEKICRYIS